MQKRAVGFVRVSTEKQQWTRVKGEKVLGESPTRQIELIKNFCNVNDFELVQLIEEKARSGARKNLNKTVFEERPDYAKLVEILKSKTVTHVVTCDLSRLGRDLLESLYFYRYFIKENGVTLISLLEGIDTSRSEDEDKIYMHLFLNHFESKRVSERTKRALAHLKSKNRATNGDAPYGYKILKDKTLAKSPEEQVVIDKVKSLFRRGYTYHKIAKYLTKHQFKNRSGTTTWYRQQIKRIILHVQAKTK